jgi:Methylase involved in ubiquinone/menaquinone biosynthesis
MTRRQCAACGAYSFHLALDASSVGHEVCERERFVTARARRRLASAERKDLLDFVHGFPCAILVCAHCGLLRRDESDFKHARTYEEDRHDFDLLKHLLPRYVTSFREKLQAYQSLLPPNAEVLEVCCHVGAFLQAAEERSWRPCGLDICKDITNFVKAQGCSVHRAILEEAPLRGRRFDAVFIWNCFEQLPDPLTTLLHVRRALKRHGLLVIRVPNALFYISFRRSGDATIRRALGYNNLLGFPYLTGHTVGTLNLLLARAGFLPVQGFNSELITMPFPDLDQRVIEEQEAVSKLVVHRHVHAAISPGALAGPWIEMIYRIGSAA